MISIFSIVRIDVLHLISVHLNAQASCQLTLFLFHIRAAHRHVWRTGVLQTPGKGKLGRCRFSSLYYIFSFSFTWISVVRFSPFAWNNLRASVTSQIILFIGLRTWVIVYNSTSVCNQFLPLPPQDATSVAVLTIPHQIRTHAKPQITPRRTNAYEHKNYQPMGVLTQSQAVTNTWHTPQPCHHNLTLFPAASTCTTQFKPAIFFPLCFVVFPDPPHPPPHAKYIPNTNSGRTQTHQGLSPQGGTYAKQRQEVTWRAEGGQRAVLVSNNYGSASIQNDNGTVYTNET